MLPDWKGSGNEHWQTHWERDYGFVRVEQHDWMQPLRGDWIARLEDVVLEQPSPCVLVAQGLGCLLVASWAAYSRNTDRVMAAMLVAPVDPENRILKSAIRGWSGLALQKLQFKGLVIGTHNDAMCSLNTAQRLASEWGTRFMDSDIGLADWPQGYQLLMQLLQQKEK